MRFESEDGTVISVGKNSLQNERLTQSARGDEIWLHAKDMPGSHVILVTEGEEPSEADYTEAAEIAAKYSSANADLVAVDYTRVKNVKKPPAAKPGLVIYHTNWTAYVTPDAEEIKRMREK